MTPEEGDVSNMSTNIDPGGRVEGHQIREIHEIPFLEMLGFDFFSNRCFCLGGAASH